MDKGTFYRLVLSKLGVSELVEGSPEHKALEECAQHAVARALDYAPWRFALVALELPLVDGFAELPGDCLELRHVFGLTRWEVAGRRIVALEAPGDATSVKVVYKSSAIADAMTLPRHEVSWCEACVCLAAATVAGRVTGNARMGLELEQLAMQALYKARLKEARAVASNDQQKGGRRHG